MRKLMLLAAMLLLVLGVMAGCESGGVPDSSISLIDRDTDEILSTPRTTGSVTLDVDQELDFKVERLQNQGGDTETSDVTTVCTYSSIPEGIISANSLGKLRALAPGTARLDVKFRANSGDPADHVYLNVTVRPLD
jgi:hypothetical protein